MKSQNAKVGIFVGSGVLLFCLSILLIGGDRFLFSERYEIKAKFHQIQGLSVGSVVSLAGIKIGNIKSVDFEGSNDNIIVTLEIVDDYKDRISANSIASVKTQGALGDKYIYIEPGEKSTPLQSGQFLQVDEGGDFLDILAKTGGEFSKVMDAFDEMRILIKAFNEEGKAGAIADNLNQLLYQGQLLMRDLRGGKDKAHLQQTIASLNSIMSKIDGSEGTLGALVNDPTLHNKLLSILGEKPRNKYLKPLIRQTIQSQKQ